VVFQVVLPLEREQAQRRDNTCESAIALKQRTIIEIPGFRVIPLKNRCSPLIVSAAAAASKFLLKNSVRGHLIPHSRDLVFINSLRQKAFWQL